MKTLAKQAFDNTFRVVLVHPYTTFFIVLAVFIAAPMIGGICGIMLDDLKLPKVVGVAALYLSLLGALVIMLNLGEDKTSSKELFWAWVTVSGVLTLLAGVGNLEIMFFKWLLF